MAESKETSAAPRASPSKQETDVAQKALNHLVQGKRHLLVEDFPLAVSTLQEACRLLSQLYGETANECGEAYFYYGRALLEMARIETDFIENPMKNEEDSDDEDDDDDEKDDDDEDEEEEEEQDGEEEGEEEEKKGGEVVKDGEDKKNGDDMKDGDDKKAEEGKESGEDKKDGEAKKDEGQIDGKEDGVKGEAAENDDEKGESLEKKEGEEEEESGEVSTLQLAWEMLELSNVIFQRQAEASTGEDKEDMELRQAEVHLQLAEVSLESENYVQAEGDLARTLEIRTRLLPPHDRLLAEPHFQLGLTMSLSSQFDRAVEHYQTAADILRRRISFLQEREQRRKERADAGEKGKEKEEDMLPEAKANPFYTEEGEIAELQKILPDIEEKMADTRASKEEMTRRKREGFFGDGMMEFGGGVSSSTFTGAPNAISTSSTANGAGPSSTSAINNIAVTSSTARASLPVAKPITNISHLIRKKRKPEDLLATKMAEPEAKRICMLENKEGEKTNGEITAKNVSKMETGSGELEKEVGGTDKLEESAKMKVLPLEKEEEKSG